MADIELVIKIPEEEYNTRKETGYFSDNFKILEAVANGTPLDDVLEQITAEIEEYKSRQLSLAIGVDDLEKGKQIVLEYVLGVIDKYK